jgi:hypothetical protein
MIAIHATKKLYAKLLGVASMKQRGIEDSKADPLDSASAASKQQTNLSPLTPTLNAVDLSSTKPSPEGEGWVTTAWTQEVEQRMEQLPRGKQNKEENLFNPPHPNLLPEGEGARTFKSTALLPILSLREREQNPLSGWHANLITVQRRNCVLLVHDATRFPLFIKGLVKADFARFDELFADALMNTLLKLGANQPQLDTATALLAPCRFDTDCNRSVQGTLNQMAGDIQHMLLFEQADLDAICSYRTGVWLANRPCTVKGQKDCIWPDKAMLALLNQVGVRNC